MIFDLYENIGFLIIPVFYSIATYQINIKDVHN